ncbi:MAG: hypothetical protein P8J55_05790, partial [Pseudomonadales bacterium]|nr:hypothetical protein [Pseudomonadales bacterium]
SLLIMAAHRPNMVKAFSMFSAEVFGGAVVSLELLNMLAHVASSAAGCTYCQAHTASKIADGGVVSEKLKSVWEFENSALFTEAERSAIRFSWAAAMVPNEVNDEHFYALKLHYTEREIVDIIGVISLFGFLNRWNDTLATPLEDGPLGVAKNLLVGRGWQAGKHHPENN